MKRFYLPLLSHSFLILVSLTCLFPIAWMVSCSFKTQSEIFASMSLIPDHFLWGNYARAWVNGKFGLFFLNSVVYTVFGVLGIVGFSSMAAYAFSRLEFPLRNFFFYMMIASLMVPIPGSFIPLYVVLQKLHLLDTRLGVILPYINGGLAFAIFLLKTFFDDLPKDLEDAARIDGAGKFRVFIHVALPLAKSAIAVVVIFNFLGIWNEFLLASIVLQSPDKMPIQVGLFAFQGTHMTDYPLLMAGLVIASAPVIVIYLIMQRHIISGITAGAIRG